MARSPQRSPLALLVLWQLIEAPMHVYRMHRLFLERGKDRVVNNNSRASLYQTIERLIRLGLVGGAETGLGWVGVVNTVGGKTHRDRVVYGITDTGREVARDWLRETLRSTGGEFPE